MEFTSTLFLLFVVSVVIAYNAIPYPAYHKIILGIANFCLIASFVTEPVQALPLAVFLAAAYGLVELLRRTKSLRLFGTSVAATLVFFVYLKRYSFFSFLPMLPFPYVVIGLSYILFRVINLMFLAYSGELTGRLEFLSSFNYLCNFLCFISGPIQRYPEHLEAERKLVPLDTAKVAKSFVRILWGYFKIAVVSSIANYLFVSLSSQILSTEPMVRYEKFVIVYALSAVAYTGYLYYNFSGYMDVVIGIGWLLGQDLPENFNKPFSAKSFLELWTRWHITLSEWFKTHMFNPLLLVLVRRFNSPRAPVAFGVISFFVTFLVMGLWHGTTPVFVVYGLLLGSGASVNKIWQIVLPKLIGKKQYKDLAANVIYSRMARALTFAYFAVALTCLWVDMDQFTGLAHRLGIGGLSIALTEISCAALIGALLGDGLELVLKRSARIVEQTAHSFVMRSFCLAGGILFILTVMTFFHKSPEFVYKVF